MYVMSDKYIEQFSFSFLFDMLLAHRVALVLKPLDS